MRRGPGKQVVLSDAIGRLAGALGSKSDGLRQIQVKEAWSEIAGPSALSHTTGAHLRGRELVVFVDTHAWATELSALSEKYRTALEEKIGKGSISRVRFTVSPKVAEELRMNLAEDAARSEREQDKVVPFPLSESERAQVEASVSAIPDKELRAAVLSATIADLEWKKGLKVAKEAEKARGGL